MTRAEADAVWLTKVDDAPAIRLAEAFLVACRATEEQRQRDQHVEGDFRARAGRVRAARVGVKIDS